MRSPRVSVTAELLTHITTIVTLSLAVLGLFVAWQAYLKADEANSIAREANSLTREANSARVQVKVEGHPFFEVRPCWVVSSGYLFSNDLRELTIVNNGGRTVSLLQIIETVDEVGLLGESHLWESEKQVSLPIELHPGQARRLTMKTTLLNILDSLEVLQRTYEGAADKSYQLNWIFSISDDSYATFEVTAKATAVTFDAGRYCDEFWKGWFEAHPTPTPVVE